MHEERWQRLVLDALVECLGLDPQFFYHEVPTLEGSRCDLVYVRNRIVAFELKKAEPGEALCKLGARGTRQLRHYRRAADSVYLVTVGAPRQYGLSVDGDWVTTEVLERQALPDGVGWIAYDVLSNTAVVLVPAPDLKPHGADRQFLADHLLNRLGKQKRAVQRCRQN